MKSKRSGVLTLSIPLIIIVAFAIIMKMAKSDSSALIIYCSHDSVFADQVLKDFTKKTGIKVIPRYDTEASKSLGLTEKIRLDGANSECDVYWSNEIFSMPVLQKDGLLEAYKGSGWQRIPAKYKDSEGYWCGFAARLRVTIINKNNFNGEAEGVQSTFDTGDLNKVAIALPLYGTTLTHFACLWRDLGKEELKKQYRDWKQRGIQIVPGNGPSRNLVANGTCLFGWTDTDDFFGAIDNKAPVKMLPIRLQDQSTICIPNTVGLLKNSKKKDLAKKLIDFLLSQETEVALANSASRQIPLGPTNQGLPQEVLNLIPLAEQGTDLSNIIEYRHDLLQWLKEEENLK